MSNSAKNLVAGEKLVGLTQREAMGEMGLTEFTNITHAEKYFRQVRQNQEVNLREEDSSIPEDKEVTTAALQANLTQFQKNNSIFNDEYNYWRSQGQAHVVAWRKAVDNWRKFSRHEVTVDWQEEVDKVTRDNSAEEVLERIQFNEIVRTVYKDLTPRQREFFCFILIQQDLDEQLDRDMFEIVATITNHQRPKEVKEIAKCMGLKLTKINVCPPLTNLRLRIREVFENHGFNMASLVRR